MMTIRLWSYYLLEDELQHTVRPSNSFERRGRNNTRNMDYHYPIPNSSSFLFIVQAGALRGSIHTIMLQYYNVEWRRREIDELVSSRLHFGAPPSKALFAIISLAFTPSFASCLYLFLFDCFSYEGALFWVWFRGFFFVDEGGGLRRFDECLGHGGVSSPRK